MAAEQWMEIYRAYTAEELASEISELQKALKGGLAAQASGTVSAQRDLGELRDRLQAATRVRNQRGGAGADGLKGQVSFRGNRWGQL